MRSSLILTVVLGSLVVLSAPLDARAQRGTDDAVEHDFVDADVVEGHLKGPLESRIVVRDGALRRSLIRPRTSFTRELRKSVEGV